MSEIKEKLINKKNKFLRTIDKNRNKNIFWKIFFYFRDKIGLIKTRLLPENYRNKIILENYKAIYFNINKVAMSSLGEAFRKISKTKELKYFGDKEKKEYKNYLKFAFVRNPYDRLVSCYENKIKKTGAEDYEKGIFVGFLKYRKFYPNMDFKEFVKAVCSISDNISDDHIKSQHKFLLDNKGKLAIDFIGKFENLEKDYKKICKKIGIKNPITLPHKKKSKRKNYRDYYDNKTKNLVSKRYKKDLELFRYKF